MRSGFRCADWLLLGLLGLLPAAEPLHAPQLLRVGEEARPHWRALFLTDPGWIGRHLDALMQAEPERWPLLFAARLLYTGDAWDPRASRSRSSVSRRRHDPPHEVIRDRILLCLRWAPAQPALRDAYAKMLERDWPTAHLLGVLDLLRDVDRGLAVSRARLLADPVIQVDRPGLRVAVQTWLFEHGALDAGDGLLPRRVMARGGRQERLEALRRWSDAQLGPFMPALGDQLLRGFAADDVSAEQRVLIQAWCRRLSCAPVGELLPVLLPLLEQGRRAEVGVLCASLAGIAPETLDEGARAQLLAILRRRIGACDDLALRHSLLGLLLAWDPAAVAGSAGHGDAWERLSRHRQQVEGASD